MTAKPASSRPWLAAYPPGVPPSYPLPRVPLSRLLDDAVRDFPTRVALVTEDVTLDYGALSGRVHDMTLALADADVRPGQRVLVALPNLASLPVVLFAIWRRGAIAVPVAADANERELCALAKETAVRVVVAPRRLARAIIKNLHEEDLRNEQQQDLGEKDRPQEAAGAHVHWAANEPPATDDEPNDPVVDEHGLTAVLVDDDWWLADNGKPRGRFRRVRQKRETSAAATPETAMTATGVHVPEPDDLAVLQPQADGPPVAYTHANVVAAAFALRLWVPDVQAGRERLLLTEPVTGYVPLVSVVAGLLSAATLILVDDRRHLGRAIERDGPTLMVATSRDIEQLAGESERRDLTSLRVVVAAGRRLTADAAAIVERRTGGARVRLAFGFADAGAICHAQPVYGRVVAGSVGLPVVDTVASVVDPDEVTVTLPAGTPGYLGVQGPQVAAGRWRDGKVEPHESTVVFDQYFTMDPDGVFYLHGPADEFVRRDERLIAFANVEAALVEHPTVVAAGVVANGDRVVAAVVAKRREHVEPADLMVHCADGSPLVPDEVIEVDELPHNEAGGLDRDALRRQLAEGGDAS